MGHKVNPKVIRLTINKTWDSKWFSRHNFCLYLRQDVVIRKFLQKKLKDAGVARIEIERSGENLNIIIYAVRPGVIIGRSGVGIEEMKSALKKEILNKQETKLPGNLSLNINIMEVDKPNLNAQIVVDNIIADLEKRIPFRRTMKQAISRVMRAGAKGVKVIVGGRLNGAEIARTEMLTEGMVPLHTLRADIDYSRSAAQTIYGKIGVKVWIYKGEVFNKVTLKS
ncbi:MAG: 30S ribosomal protein S3 [Candidatus Buchananbacteria bacterium RBG_13_39_9]|jgi:small subunit ribosomal protein S3|uniref:Small ribosomal subunit protein uS3 n=1 Tax=Candidatus Buchananbacteria bacterium RBG_13_39_9 TaxID=1797531 RepID=A0A1G1XQ07_9BACT|nr:MAG: 30S ribosomal protein S3 [Candidatus Buchananbacteria bacterium RBG_13_39_9]